MKKGKLTIVGAGPGDPELITLKGVRVLKAADVLLYDALANEAFLDYAPNAEKVFVGKRKGMHKFIQEKIHELIVEYASQGKHVVRLKGGDPFIFGRGAEELNYALEHGIEDVDIVQGVTSAISAPASFGISLTQRGVNESFRVITGTTSDESLSEDVEASAKSNVTIVVLMAMNKLEHIVSIFKKLGKTEDPVAIIENGTKDIEQLAIGTIDTILPIVDERGLSNPSIIVIGETVKQSERLYRYFLDKKGKSL